MTDQPAAPDADTTPTETAPPADAAPAEAAAAPVPNRQEMLRGFLNRIAAGEFDGAGDAFHRFVVKDVYPLLTGGTFTAADVETIARHFSLRTDPYNQPASA